jgi:hypothetical protein
MTIESDFKLAVLDNGEHRTRLQQLTGWVGGGLAGFLLVWSSRFSLSGEQPNQPAASLQIINGQNGKRDGRLRSPFDAFVRVILCNSDSAFDSQGPARFIQAWNLTLAPQGRSKTRCAFAKKRLARNRFSFTLIAGVGFLKTRD